MWCPTGDFNAISSSGEQMGLNTHDNRSEMEEFRAFINEMELIEVSMVGKKFTWFKSDRTTSSRLDRFLLPEELISMWKLLSRSVIKIYRIIAQ